MNRRGEFGRELEKSLTSLAKSFSQIEIDQHNRDLLIEFVENREYQVALEWLDALVFERSIRLSVEQETEFQRLAALMNIDFRQSRGEK
jgi:hypothetical protein